MAGIVLVHGFWADGSSWGGVIPRLVAGGHDPIAVQLPLSSFADDVATVRRAAARLEGPIVLAAHSYGGVVISEAAAGLDSVRGLVYVAAYAPELGEDVNALNERFPPASGAAIRPTEDGHLWLDLEGYRDAFCADVDAADAAVMARTQGPASFECLTGLTQAPAWHDQPCWSLIATDDRTIAPDAQRFMAERMNASVTEVAASHAALVSRPAETAEVILAAASAAG